jgi:hypothetical protein
LERLTVFRYQCGINMNFVVDEVEVTVGYIKEGEKFIKRKK